jgi:GT2 family glycosyltransferase
MKDLKTSTIIVTYNGMSWIEDCLNSVIRDTSVIVVDNGSTDGTTSFIRENFKAVVLLEQHKNLGFGKANNLGISYAINNGADYVLLLNQDAKMAEASITQLIDFSKLNPEYGILSPIHCDWSGDYLESSFSAYVNYTNNKNFYSDFVLNKSLREVYDILFVAAACWFIPTTIFKTIGGFDPIFFHLGEDVNYAQRLRYHGYKIGVLPNLKVHHDTKNRAAEKIELYSNQYYYKLNYRNKIKYADINLDNWTTKLKYNKRQVLKVILLALITFNFKTIKGAYKDYLSYNAMAKECGQSRAVNKLKGSHYLTLN